MGEWVNSGRFNLAIWSIAIVTIGPAFARLGAAVRGTPKRIPPAGLPLPRRPRRPRQRPPPVGTPNRLLRFHHRLAG
jgi:hypothetical protein